MPQLIMRMGKLVSVSGDLVSNDECCCEDCCEGLDLSAFTTPATVTIETPFGDIEYEFDVVLSEPGCMSDGDGPYLSRIVRYASPTCVTRCDFEKKAYYLECINADALSDTCDPPEIYWYQEVEGDITARLEFKAGRGEVVVHWRWYCELDEWRTKVVFEYHFIGTCYNYFKGTWFQSANYADPGCTDTTSTTHYNDTAAPCDLAETFDIPVWGCYGQSDYWIPDTGNRGIVRGDSGFVVVVAPEDAVTPIASVLVPTELDAPGPSDGCFLTFLLLEDYSTGNSNYVDIDMTDPWEMWDCAATSPEMDPPQCFDPTLGYQSLVPLYTATTADVAFINHGATFA